MVKVGFPVARKDRSFVAAEHSLVWSYTTCVVAVEPARVSV